MMNTFYNTLSRLDYFGERISLRLNKQTSSKTELGGFLTSLLFLSIFSIWIYQSLSVFYHTSPKVSIETQYLIEREEINLNSTTMPLAFGFTNFGSVPLDLSQYMIFKVSLHESINSANGTVYVTYLDFKLCEKENFPLISDDHFAYYGLNSMYCLKNQNFTIKGYWDETIMNYLSIKTFYCVENYCKSSEEINKLLSQQLIYFNVYTLNNALNPQKYETPITQHLLNLYSGIKLNFNKIVEVYIKNENLQSDDNILFPNFMKENYNSISYDYREMDDNSITKDGCLMEYQLISSKNKVIYYRVYTKITEVLASIGGLMNVLMFLLKLICSMFSRMTHNVKILNKIYHYDIEDEEEDERRNYGFANRLVKIANENPKYTRAVSRALTKMHNSDFSSKTDSIIENNQQNKISVSGSDCKERNKNMISISFDDKNGNVNPVDKSRNKYAQSSHIDYKIPTEAKTTNGQTSMKIISNTIDTNKYIPCKLKSKISIHPNDNKWEVSNKEPSKLLDDKYRDMKITSDQQTNNNFTTQKSNDSKISLEEEYIIANKENKEKKKEKRLSSLRRASKNILMLFNFAKGTGPSSRKSKDVNTNNMQNLGNQNYKEEILERIDSDMDILVNANVNNKSEKNCNNDKLISPSTEAINYQYEHPLTLKEDENENEIENNKNLQTHHKKNTPAHTSNIKRTATMAITEKKSEHEVKDLIQTIISIKSDKHNLNFSLFEIFKTFACRCFIKRHLNSRYLLYNKSYGILDEILDVCNIIQKLDELEKIKMILLSKEQLALFNFISKDWCSLNNPKLINSKVNEMKEFNKNQESLAKVFVSFLKELGTKSQHDEEVNEVNEKLLDFLHEDFKNNFIQALDEKN